MTGSAQGFMLGGLIRSIPLRHRCDQSASRIFLRMIPTIRRVE
jgi:hypothetical protein